MNIWEAYCKPELYNIYFVFLKAKGFKTEEIQTLKTQYVAYIQRMKSTRFASDLKKIVSREEFLLKLKEIFYEKWSGKLQYKKMPYHYERYMDFLDTMQVLYNDYINDEEKQRLINPNFDIPIVELTKYEKEYLVDGKLVALTNPQLVHILKEYIETIGMSPGRLTLVCREFYDGLLPNMEPDDYQALLEMLWSPARKVRRGGGRSKIQITFPDGRVEQYSFFNAAQQVISIYGFEETYKLKPQMRGEPFLTRSMPYGKEKMYRELDSGQYMRIDGNYKDYLNILRLINIHFGRKLKVDLC